KPWTWRRALRDHGPAQHGLLVTLYTLGTYMNDDGLAYPGQDTLARGAHASVRTIRRHMKEAEALGWVHIELSGRTGQGWRHYVYRSVVPDHVPLEGKDRVLADLAADECRVPQGTDTAMSSPTSRRADTIVSPPSSTCGHAEQEGADIPREGADKLVA